MLYLSPPTGSERVRDAMAKGLIGCIDTPGQRQVADGRYALDNGCGPGVRGIGAGYPGDDRWLRWVTEHPGDRARCLFAVAPDVVGDAPATLARSAPWLPVLRRLGYPAALVAQDGLEHLPIPWAAFDVLFIGGSTAWKLGTVAAAITREATARGVPVHMGRVNSLKRIRYAHSIGCSTADGTFLRFGPDKNLPEVLGWLDDLQKPQQGVLL